MILVYNTLTRKKEELKTRAPKRADIFVCGPTVYDFSHLGHARTYIIFDVIVQYLRAQGWNIRYLQNITDVDDKIIQRAKDAGEDALALAHRFETEYLKDMAALKIASVDRYARASEHIAEIIAQIATLIEKGYAYETPTGIYFSVKSFGGYGKLSHQKLSEMKNAVRIEEDRTKRDPVDFALWKKTKQNEEIGWASPWGQGRPGWHIEDTAIAEKYFGPQYDIHGGGLDLIFPHHESEIAQMEAASGAQPYVRYWLHTGFLNVQGEKMAKSTGNFVTIRELLARFRPEAFRLFVLQTHYRSPIDYRKDLVEQAGEALKRLIEFRDRLKEIPGGVTDTARAADVLEKTKKAFEEHMADDFNTAEAVAALFVLAREMNTLLDKNAVGSKDAARILEFLEEIDAVFQIFPNAMQEEIPKEILALVAQREMLRDAKDFHAADEIRAEIEQKGFLLEDTVNGPRAKRV